MAHQIFGETENIFGYKNLQINVYYSAGPLDIYYDVKYSKKVRNFHFPLVPLDLTIVASSRSTTCPTTTGSKPTM